MFDKYNLGDKFKSDKNRIVKITSIVRYDTIDDADYGCMETEKDGWVVCIFNCREEDLDKMEKIE